MDRIFKNGAVSRHTLTEYPSISAQCWGSMLHGVDCRRHGLTNTIAESGVPYPLDSPYPSVFRVIREAMPEAKLASFCDWGAINKGIVEDGIGVYKYQAKDYELVEPAIDYINKNDFTFLYFHFDSVDGAGHDYGYGSPKHLEMITRNDGYIGRIVDAVEKRGWSEETLILVEADHGGTPDEGFGGSHGGASDAEQYVSFFAAGGNVRHTELTDMMVRDTAPIIAHALGIPQPEGWAACVPAGLFPDCMEKCKRPKGILSAEMKAERPVTEEKGEFLSTFADLEPLLYLPFEKDEDFPEGTQMHGKLYRVEGVKGQGMRFEDGYLTMPCPPFKKWDTLSLTFWVRLDEGADMGMVVAAGSSCKAPDKIPGFSMAVGTEHIRLLCKEVSKIHYIPMDLIKAVSAEGRWMFVVMSIDLKERKLGISVDFEKFADIGYWQLPPDTELPDGELLYIGQNAENDKANRLAGVLDDVCIYKRALDDADVDRFKKYYS